MKTHLGELDSLIINNLHQINSLKNDVKKKEIEIRDQLKDFALGIIDVLDSFERISENLIEKGLDNSEDGSRVMNRYNSIEKKLVRLLQRYNITRMSFPDNKLIVGWCIIKETVADSSKSNDEIVSVIKNGYVNGDQIIREADVITVRN